MILQASPPCAIESGGSTPFALPSQAVAGHHNISPNWSPLPSTILGV